LQVLEEKMKGNMAISGTSIFQQDSAPCHKAKVVTKWFSDNNVSLLQNWPPNSPDLNVIENVWTIMKRRVAAHKPTSEAQLKAIIKEVWVREISPDYCKSLVRSMPDRIMSVIRNKGFPTKY
jgi:hypothetical protein